jgi:hypothetical protein
VFPTGVIWRPIAGSVYTVSPPSPSNILLESS